jgi:hypothetical protein
MVGSNNRIDIGERWHERIDVQEREGGKKRERGSEGGRDN